VPKGSKPPSWDTAPAGAGQVVITERAIADLVGWTVLECYGVVGMASANLARGVGRLLSRDRLHQGIKIEQTADHLKVDLFVVVEYGLNVAEVAGNVRAQVAYNVARITGRAVDELHIHVQGVRFGDQ
jgi:uncharacterized alkaline shock family protein YloU